MKEYALDEINLASEPFRQERAQNAIWLLICGFLGLLLIVLGVSVLRERARAADLRQQIAAEQNQLQLLNRESAKSAEILRRPANADVFSRNVFLNELIARRAVSWTVLFRDLEKLLPPNVRLVGIRLPQVSGGNSASGAAAAGVNRVQLDMIVGTDRPETIVDLLGRLNRSSLFGTARVLGETPPSQNDPLYKFRVTVPYAQKL